jgi:hypothetical protein
MYDPDEERDGNRARAQLVLDVRSWTMASVSSFLRRKHLSGKLPVTDEKDDCAFHVRRYTIRVHRGTIQLYENFPGTQSGIQEVTDRPRRKVVPWHLVRESKRWSRD